MPFSSDTASPSSASPATPGGAPASLATLLAAADSVESRVLGWLHSLPSSPAELSIADLNSAAQALWRLTAVRKTLALIAGYAPPTRPRGVHVMPPDAHPHYYPYKSKEEYDAHLAWCLEMSRSLSPGGIDPAVEIDRPWGDEDDDATGATLESFGPIGRSAFQAGSDASIVAPDKTLESSASPVPAAMATPSSAQAPDSPNPQLDPTAHASSTPEQGQSSPTAPQFPPPRALSISSCPAIPGKLPSIPSGDPARPSGPLLSAGASQSVSNESSTGVADPSPEGAHDVGRLFKPTLIPPRASGSFDLAKSPRPEGPAANSPARQGGVRAAVSLEARRAGTADVQVPPVPSVPFPKAPLEFGVVVRPSRPP